MPTYSPSEVDRIVFLVEEIYTTFDRLGSPQISSTRFNTYMAFNEIQDILLRKDPHEDQD